MTRIVPLNDRVFVQRSEAEDRVGRIFVPENAKEKPQEGVVKYVGPGTVMKDGTRRPVGVKVGDRVLFTKYGGSDLEIDDQKLVILTEKEILAVLERTD